MPSLSRAERDAFLTERGILMRIATVRPDGSPHVTPIWFLFEDGSIWFTPRLHSEWRRNLLHDRRVALSIDEQPLPYRKVIVEGEAELVHAPGEDDRWRDRYRRITRRYVGEAETEAYVEGTDDQPRALYRIDLAKARVRTWRMPVEDEPYSGIWHQRYYAPGSKILGS